MAGPAGYSGAGPGTDAESPRERGYAGGEIQVGVINQFAESYTISPGERIAQLVVMPVSVMPVEECETLDETERGAGGFGSTGKQ